MFSEDVSPVSMTNDIINSPGFEHMVEPILYVDVSCFLGRTHLRRHDCNVNFPTDYCQC